MAVLAVWGASTIATTALAALPVATFLPLLLLAGGFEAIANLHAGVERIGRYLQVFYTETDVSHPVRDWERLSMAYGRTYHTRSDPLFVVYFLFATVLNFVPVLLAEPVQLEVTVVGAVHLLFIGRLFFARHAASRQRALELERFERLKAGGQA